MHHCPSNMVRHSFPDLYQLNLQAPASFDASDNNFLDNLLTSVPSGQWPELPGADLEGDSGIAVFDQSQMLPAAEFVDGEYHNGVVSRGGSAFDSFPDQTTFTGQSHVLSGMASAGDGGGDGTSCPTQTKKKVRAKRGQATDPHSIAERLRRVRISERMKALQELVPNANRTDKASMLDEIIEYVKFLQVQVKLLSASRLGGASGDIAPSAVDIPSQEIGGGKLTANGRQHNGDQASSGVSSLTVTEHRVAKLMEEDMGSAMQYLQGKGLCLLPISLAATISTASGSSRGVALS